MTNWMTAAGIALIAGGLAVLIGFRHVLRAPSGERSGGERRRSRTPRAIEAPRRPALSARPAGLTPAGLTPAGLTPAGLTPAGLTPAELAPAEAARAAAVPAPPRRAGRRALETVPPASKDSASKPSTSKRPALKGPASKRMTPERVPAKARNVDHGELGPADRDRVGLLGRDPEDVHRADRGGDHIDLLGRDAGDGVDIDLGDMPPVHRPASGLARIGLADDEDAISGDVFADGEDAISGSLFADDEDAISGGLFADHEDSISGDLFAASRSEAEADALDAVQALEAEIEAEVEAGIDAELDEIDERIGELEERIDERLDSPPAGIRAPRIDRYGHRIEGWVRPEYQDGPKPGEYWTPVPESSYADAGYGWPVPVERLPAVPAYSPQSGFDLDPDEAAEPTAVVPQWPPARPSARIELPRGWAQRDQKERRGAATIQRRRAGDPTQTLPAVDDGDREPPRRRPRPRPSPPDAHSTVYRSRHAADPG